MEGRKLVQRQFLAEHLFPDGVVDRDLHRSRTGQGVVHVIVGAQDAAEVDDLSGAVDGAVGVDVGAVIQLPVVYVQPKVPGKQRD